MPEFSRCRCHTFCHTFVLLYVATGRGSRVKMLLRQDAGFGHVGRCEWGGGGLPHLVLSMVCPSMVGSMGLKVRKFRPP